MTTQDSLHADPGATAPATRPARVAIMGSCISRDNFNSRFNPRYKQFYSCDLMQNQASLISLMSEGFSLTAEQYGQMSAYDQWNVRTDLNKEFLELVVAEQPDYLILDFFGDVHFGCVRLEDGRFITNNRWKLWKTGFYQDLKARNAVDEFRIEREPEEYIRVWQEAFDRFAAFIAQHLPETTVIVHHGHNTAALQLPGQLETVPLQQHRKNAKMDLPLANELWRRLDTYASATPGYEVIDLTEGNYPTLDDHPWGPFYVHYTMDYYSRFLTELHKIHLRHGAAQDADLSVRLVEDVETLATVGPTLKAEQERLYLERVAAEARARAERTTPAKKAAAQKTPDTKAAAKKTARKAPAPPPTFTVRAKRRIRRGIRRLPLLEQAFQTYARMRPRTGAAKAPATAAANTGPAKKAVAKKTVAKKAVAKKGVAQTAVTKKAVPAPAKKAAPKAVTFGRVEATIATARWLDATTFEVTGWVYSKGVSATSASRPELTLSLHNAASGRTQAVEVEQREDVELAYTADDPKVDYRGAGFRTVLDLSSLLAPEQQQVRWRLAFALRSGETSFEGWFANRLTNGSAGRIVPSPRSGQVGIQPFWSLREGLAFEARPAVDTAPEEALDEPVSGPQIRLSVFSLQRDAAPSVRMIGSLEGADPAGSRFELRGPQGIIVVDRVQWQGPDFTAVAPLVVKHWGDGPAPLMQGTYDLWVLLADGSAVPVRLEAEAVQGFPDQLQSDKITVRLLRTEDDQPRIHLRSPLRPEEVGKIAQERLNTAYKSTTIVPDGSVYFESFYGRSATDSPRAIHDELVRRGSDRTMYWAVADYSVAVPEGAVPIIVRSREWYDTLARCSYFFHNEGTPAPLRKRDDQVVVQTWHGTPLKLLGYDRPFNRNTPGWGERMARSTSKWDFMIAGNSYSAEIFRHAYAFGGTMLDLGYPRNDVLVDPGEELIGRLRERLGVTQEQKVVLYAPTWRDGDAKVVGYLDPEELGRALGPDWVILVRGHTNTLRNAQRKVGAQVIDVTSYPQVNDLFLAADVMITDYSSIMFDYSVTGKPMMFYVPDLDDYQDRRRGTYFDLGSTAPGPLLTTSDQVVDALRSVDQGHDAHAQRYADWRDKFNPRDDGQASGRVIDAVFTR